MKDGPKPSTARESTITSPTPGRKGPAPRDIVERFFEKVEEAPGGCWIWTAYRSRHGYGRFGVNRAHGPVLAHRWSWTYRYGPIPDGLTLDHLCRVPACVNPDHLEPVPHAVNLARMPNRPHAMCRKGLHEMSVENRKKTTTGSTCKACAQANNRRYYLAGKSN